MAKWPSFSVTLIDFCINNSLLFSPPEFLSVERRFKYVITECVQQKERFSCAKCKDILIKPYQTVCGCRFCSSCLEQCNRVCPGCGDTIPLSDNNNLTYDKATEREIAQLRTKCIHEQCTYECKLRDLVNHLEKCQFTEDQTVKMKCDDCGLELLKKEFNETHRNINGNIKSLCDKWSGVCPFNCCDTIQDNIKIHLIACSSMPLDCPMKDIGCTERLPRFSMDDHIKNDVQSHMILIMQELVKVKEENTRLKLEQAERKYEFSIAMEELQNAVAIKNCEISDLKGNMSLLEMNYKTLLNEANAFKQSMKWNGVPRSCSPISPSSASSITGDGYFVWKVDNIVSKIKDAKRGINTHIFSDPFYTHTPGYKMCLKMYPAGDGKRAENHISLYFVIMQGEYDEEVAWPFRKKISLSLQSNEVSIKNKTINMKPDNNNSCYGKPTSAHNLAAGQPKFVSHVELISTDEFIENDAIIIRAQVF